MAAVKVSIEPLVERYGTRAALAEAAGMHPSNFYRLDGIKLKTAEDWCDRLGLHPREVWPEWLALVAKPDLPPMRVCAAEDCDNEFPVPKQCPRKKYCHPRCKSRVHMRARYRADPAPKREANARYRDENAEYEKQRRRTHYRLHRGEVLRKQWERDERRRQERRAAA